MTLLSIETPVTRKAIWEISLNMQGFTPIRLATQGMTKLPSSNRQTVLTYAIKGEAWFKAGHQIVFTVLFIFFCKLFYEIIYIIKTPQNLITWLFDSNVRMCLPEFMQPAHLIRLQ
jgi:hypothetical protein